LEPFFIDNSI